MKACFHLLCVAICLTCSRGAAAYNEFVTHPQLSREALVRSQLKLDPTLLPRLGLKPYVASERFNRPENTIEKLLTDGVTAEDLGSRALNHFYDPYFDRPLTVLSLSLGKKSPDWSLEDAGDVAGQLESYKDARESIYQALTYNQTGIPVDAKAQVRTGYWASTFYDLGHVIHHIQDMAQPQHVRNDAHCDLGFIDCVGFYNPSRYEAYSAAREGAFTSVGALAVSAGPAIFPGSADFKTPRDFWKNAAGSGMAEFVNRNFVSQGTNFTMSFFGNVVTSKYPLPRPGMPQDYSINALFGGVNNVPAKIRALCDGAGIDCQMTMYPTPLSAKASTLSIFDQDLEPRGLSATYNDGYSSPTYAVSRLFALNRFNFDDAHQILIPKAVAYSAGLINYFFRGSMDISLPDEGVYAIVDHSRKNIGTPATQFVGFSKIKLKLANTSGEAMVGGKLLAVLKFRRNTLYANDLSQMPPTINADTARSGDEEIVVSAELAGVTLTGAAQTFSFTFSQELPLNATDVYLQVVYRGPLGSESDAVVVATKTISEPTFYAFSNDRDYIRLGGVIYTREQINASVLLMNQVMPTDCIDRGSSGNAPPTLRDVCFKLELVSVTFRMGGAQTPLASVADLPVTGYVRMALLTDFNSELPVVNEMPAGATLPGPCQPQSFLVPSIDWKTVYYADGSSTLKSTLFTLQGRGVWGSAHVSCIHIGDGSDPAAPDNRKTQMAVFPPPVPGPTAVNILPPF